MLNDTASVNDRPGTNCGHGADMRVVTYENAMRYVRSRANTGGRRDNSRQWPP